jgi:cytochrome c5
MKHYLLPILITVTTLAFIQSCKHEPEDVITPGGSGGTDTTAMTNSDTCSLDTVYFYNDILPIFASNCAQSGCHDVTSHVEDLILTDYKNIMATDKIKPGKALDSDLYKALKESDPKKIMPPPPASITPEQINAIKIWINQGAKNNRCSNICDTSNVRFSVNVWPIMNTTCRGCHSGSGASGGVKITSYAEVKAIVDNGVLVNVLSRNGPKKPMPPGGPIEKCANDQIRIWIAAGAKNN